MFQTLRFVWRLLQMKRACRMTPQAAARLQAQRLERLVRIAVGRSPYDVKITQSLRPDPKTGKVRRIVSRIGPPADLAPQQERADMTDSHHVS